MKRIILTDKAPQPIGPFSQAVEINGMLFVSGQLPINPTTGKIVDGSIKEQTICVFDNIQAILKEAQYSLFDVVKVTCLLSNMDDFNDMNTLYQEVFRSDFPARITYSVVKLPLNVLIEVDIIAVKKV